VGAVEALRAARLMRNRSRGRREQGDRPSRFDQ
jgi:hypothetical protein